MIGSDPEHAAACVVGGCYNDTNDMAAIARAAGYQVTVSLDAEATLHDAPDGRVERCRADPGSGDSGDTLVLTHAGHSTQVPDQNGDKDDGR